MGILFSSLYWFARINATFAPRPVRCTYHVARSELCLLHKPHQINIPSRPRSSNGLILAYCQTTNTPLAHSEHVFGRRCPPWPASRDPGGLHALASPSRADRRCSDRARARRRRRSLSGRLREPTSTGRAWTTARRGTLGRRCCSARPVWSGARPIMASRYLGCGLAPTDPLNAPSGRRTGGFSF